MRMRQLIIYNLRKRKERVRYFLQETEANEIIDAIYELKDDENAIHKTGRKNWK